MGTAFEVVKMLRWLDFQKLRKLFGKKVELK